MRGPAKGGAETSAWQSYTGFCALPASGAAQGSSSCREGCRDNEWIFIKWSKYALITLIGLLWFQLWQNFIFCSSDICFWSSSCRQRKSKSPAEGGRRSPGILILQFAHRALGRLVANDIPHLIRDFEGVFQRMWDTRKWQRKTMSKKGRGIVLFFIINRPNSEYFQGASTQNSHTDFICGVEMYLCLQSDWQPDKESCPEDSELLPFREHIWHLTWPSPSCSGSDHYWARSPGIVRDAEMGCLRCHRGWGQGVSG